MSKSASPQKDPKTGTWGFVVDAGVDPATGKRRQVRRRGFHTKRAAQAELDKVRQAAQEGSYIAPDRQTVGEWLDQWLRAMESRVRPATHHSYEQNMRVHVKPRIGAARLQRVDGAALNHLYRDLEAVLSPRSIRYIHTILQGAFGEAVKVRRLSHNPCDAATPPQASAVKRREILTWSPEEVAEFLRRSAASKDALVALWTLLATTGMRRGEALGLRWRDVDLAAGTASISQTVVVTGHERFAFSTPKTAAGSRLVDLDPETVRALREHRKRQASVRMHVGAAWTDHDLVFARADGRPHDPGRITNEFQRRIKRWGMRRIRLHDLRHTWATLALKGGVNVKVVQERLGHSSPLITQHLYQHVLPGMGREAGELVAGMIFGCLRKLVTNP